MGSSGYEALEVFYPSVPLMYILIYKAQGEGKGK